MTKALRKAGAVAVVGAAITLIVGLLSIFAAWADLDWPSLVTDRYLEHELEAHARDNTTVDDSLELRIVANEVLGLELSLIRLEERLTRLERRRRAEPDDVDIENDIKRVNRQIDQTRRSIDIKRHGGGD